MEHIPDIQAFDQQAIAGRLRQLDALVQEMWKRDPPPHLEYEQARILAIELVEESRMPGFFWQIIPVESRGVPGKSTVHSTLFFSLIGLRTIAQRVGVMEQTSMHQLTYEFLLRLFHDPETRRLQRLALTGRDAVNEGTRFDFYREGSDFAGVREHLRSQDLLSAEDWILNISGLLWEGPQHLVWRDDIAFASLEALQESGARIAATGRLVTIRNKDQRLDLPIIDSRDPTGRSAYRDPAGRIYIPVEELAHRKVAHVRIAPDPKEKANPAISGSQMVFISPTVDPKHITAPNRMRLPETRRKPPAEKQPVVAPSAPVLPAP